MDARQPNSLHIETAFRMLFTQLPLRNINMNYVFMGKMCTHNFDNLFHRREYMEIVLFLNSLAKK